MVEASCCQARYAAFVNAPNRGALPPRVSSSTTTSSAAGQGSGFIKTPYVTLNSAVVAQIPIAIVRQTSSAKRG